MRLTSARRFAFAAGVAASLLVPAAVASAAPAGPGPTLTFPEILSGYSRPILVTHDGVHDDRLFIVEQTGRIKVARLVDGTWRKRGVFLDLRDKAIDPFELNAGEQGLLGLAFDPDYISNRRFYVNYTRRSSGDRHGDTVIAEYRRATVHRADPTSGRTVMIIDQPETTHNGGHITFGPDGFLYLGMGDGGGQGDPDDNGQDLGTPLGKFLRIDPEDPAGPKRYSVPASNPYVGQPGKRGSIWLNGTRNPWRWSFDRDTGDLWIGDVGGANGEEIDKLPATGGEDAGKGVNLGWDVCEGDRALPDTGACDHGGLGFVGPVFDYRHAGSDPLDGGCAVTGGYVYRGPGAAAWQGLYLFSDFCTGVVGVLAQDGELLLSVDSPFNVSSFGEDRSGRLYIASLLGTIRAIEMAGDPTP